MARHNDKGKEVAELYAGLRIEDEDEGIELEEIQSATQDKDKHFIIIARFLNDKIVHFDSMKNTLAAIWRPVKGVTITETATGGRYLFQFYHELDMVRVLNDGPWTFNQNVLIIKQLLDTEQEAQVDLNFLLIWVQIVNLPIGFQTEETCKVIGNKIGKFVEADPKNFKGPQKGYVRIKVAIDIRNPLKRGQKIRRSGGEWLWIDFRYERLPHFCFFCGIIGHADKFCNQLFDLAERPTKRAYGIHLRAAVRRNNLHVGKAWLREDMESEGGANWGFQPTNMEVEDNGYSGRIQRDVEKSHNLRGIKIGIAMHEGGGKSGANDGKYAGSEEGLILDVKRARLEEGYKEAIQMGQAEYNYLAGPGTQACLGP